MRIFLEAAIDFRNNLSILDFNDVITALTFMLQTYTTFLWIPLVFIQFILRLVYYAHLSRVPVQLTFKPRSDDELLGKPDRKVVAVGLAKIVTPMAQYVS